jgi:DNA-binding NarL/FixJ family response regulator
MRVLIADDHPIVRKALRRLFERSGIDVVAEAGDARESLQLAVRERPDIALLDLFMPAGGGLEATRRILRRCPGTRVVILSGFVGSGEATDALRAGAIAFIPKTAAHAEILGALRAAHDGRGSMARSSMAADGDRGLTRLTEREREVLEMVARGHSSSSAAALLGVSGRTIDAHRQKIMDKLGIHCVSGLTRFAIERGIA